MLVLSNGNCALAIGIAAATNEIIGLSKSRPNQSRYASVNLLTMKWFPPASCTHEGKKDFRAPDGRRLPALRF